MTIFTEPPRYFAPIKPQTTITEKLKYPSQSPTYSCESKIHHSIKKLMAEIAGNTSSSSPAVQKFTVYSKRTIPRSTLESVISLIVDDKLNTPKPIKKKLIKQFSKFTNNKISLSKSGVITVHLKNRNLNTNIFLRIISLLSHDQRKHVSIELELTKCHNGIETSPLIENYGNDIDTLILNECILDDQHLERLLIKFPNISRLNIFSDMITTLNGFDNLKKLSKLNCEACESLATIPPHPNLQTLICIDCKLLEAIAVLPNLNKLNCNGCSSLTDLPFFPNLTTLDCSYCYYLKNLPLLPKLKKLICVFCIAIVELPKFPLLEVLNCRDCGSLTNIPLLPSLINLNCSKCLNLFSLPLFPQLVNLNCSYSKFEEIPPLSNLKSLVCQYQSELTSIPLLPKLELLNTMGSYSVSFRSVFFCLFHIFLKNKKQLLKLKINVGCAHEPHKQLYNFLNSQEVSYYHLKNGVTKGELRKRAILTFPLLLEFIVLKFTIDWPIPKELQSAMDSGKIFQGLKEYFKLSPNTLRRIPLSHNNAFTTHQIIGMLQQKVIKPKWLPWIHREKTLRTFSDPNKCIVIKNFQEEQQAFCDTIAGCIRLSDRLGFLSKLEKNSSIPTFLVHLIEATASDKSKTWKEKARSLPTVLKKEVSGIFHIADALEDFVKTVFLPYYIQNQCRDIDCRHIEELFGKKRYAFIQEFLKGVPLSAVAELSSHWHKPGTLAQLNKTKTYSEEKWEPLFTSLPSYVYDGKRITITPLVTCEHLEHEGQALSHCIKGYTSRCLRKNSHILSFRNEKGVPLSTIELLLYMGIGDETKSEVINIKEEKNFHLRLNQHSGKNNGKPPTECSIIQEQFFDDLKNGTISVDLPQIHKKNVERIKVLDERKDLLLTGYDVKDEVSLKKAIETYRKYGIGNISHAKTLLANFDVLTGKREPQKQIQPRKRIGNYTPLVKSSLQKLFPEVIETVSVDKTNRQKFGEVVITLHDSGRPNIENFQNDLIDIHPKLGNITEANNGGVKIEGLSPKIVAQLLNRKIKILYQSHSSIAT